MKLLKVGEIHETDMGGSITILEYTDTKNVNVKFNDEHGAIINVTAKAINKGNVKNPYVASVYGKGYLGVGSFVPYGADGKPTQTYVIWRSMLARCYNLRRHVVQPTYKGCTVCDEWLNYQTFSKWYTTNKYYGSGFHLDKDMLITGNKQYSPDACCLLPPIINGLFNKVARGKYPLGVIPNNKRYKARISIDGEFKHLGCFNTVKQASNAYKEAKLEYVKMIAYRYIDEIDVRIFEYMLNWKPD